MTVKVKNSLFLLTVITNRGRAKVVRKALKEQGIDFSLQIMGMGTARTRILDYLGLSERERDIMWCAVTRSDKAKVMRRLQAVLDASGPGSGIAFTIPMKGLAGSSTLKLLGGDTTGQGCEVKGDCLVDTPSAELIVSIVNHGYASEVMEAAKTAGAQGGTVIHGRGTGGNDTAKFFKITVEPEKEVVLILVRKEVRSDVIRAISAAAGLKVPGRGIIFSLPVEDVVGVYGIDDHVS